MTKIFISPSKDNTVIEFNDEEVRVKRDDLNSRGSILSNSSSLRKLLSRDRGDDLSFPLRIQSAWKNLVSIRNTFICSSILVVLATAALVVPYLVTVQLNTVRNLANSVQSEVMDKIVNEIHLTVIAAETSSQEAIYYISNLRGKFLVPNATSDLDILWHDYLLYFQTVLTKKPSGAAFLLLMLPDPKNISYCRFAGLNNAVAAPTYFENLLLPNGTWIMGVYPINPQNSINAPINFTRFAPEVGILVQDPYIFVEGYETLSHGDYWTDLYTQEVAPGNIIVDLDYVRPLFDGTEWIGNLVTATDVSNLNNVLHEFNLGTTGKAFICTSTGKLIATSTYADIFTFDETTQTFDRVFIYNSSQEWISQVSRQVNLYENNKIVKELKIGGVAYFFTSFKYAHNNFEWVVVQMAEQSEYLGETKKTETISIVVVCILVLFVSLITLGVSFVVTRPLYNLSGELEKVSRLELDLCNLQSSRFREVKMMHHSFAMMHVALSSFKLYVPTKVITNILKTQQEAIVGLSPTKATILFMDIENFTTMSEQMDPNLLAEFCGAFFEEMSTIIVNHGGTIDKYIGDCIMAVFNIPESLPKHTNRACLAAINCQNALMELNLTWKTQYGRTLTCRTGIHTGEVLAGNMGSSQRLNYTAIGDNVNIAARLESVNKYYGSKILISEEVFTVLDTEFLCRRLSTVRVSGKNLTTSIYQLLDRITPEDKRPGNFDTELVQSYEDALSAFERREFVQAKVHIEKALSFQPSDIASHRLKSRIEAAIAMPYCPEDWDFIENLVK